MPIKRIPPAFKAYVQQQPMLLPPDLSELIELGHPVRIVNSVLDSLNLDLLLAKYPGGGSSAYHPRLMLKVLVYAYITNLYSSRPIADACRTNVHFMWLAAMARPDHNTINRFRSERLKDVLHEVFAQVVKVLAAEGLLSLEEVFTDGTKMRANASPHTFVWKNGIHTNKEKTAKQLEEIWNYAQSVASADEKEEAPLDFSGPALEAEKVKAVVEKIDKTLRKAAEKDASAVDPKIKAKVARVKKAWPAALEKYKKQEEILDGRNSYSTTDPDATFMRQKDDKGAKPQLKPGYNLQVSSSNQFAVDFTIHSNSGDSTTLPAHLAQIKKSFGSHPTTLTADAGYGSEENYEMLQEQEVKAFVKYNYFDKDNNETARQRRSGTEIGRTSGLKEGFTYNPKADHYICRAGKLLLPGATETNHTTTGFAQVLTIYRAQGCHLCPLRESCPGPAGNREVKRNKNMEAHRDKAYEALRSKEGFQKRMQRNHDIEGIFGNLKWNHGFRRYLLRGNAKVEIETGLLLLAHNLRKKIRKTA